MKAYTITFEYGYHGSVAQGSTVVEAETLGEAERQFYKGMQLVKRTVGLDIVEVWCRDSSEFAIRLVGPGQETVWG